MIWILDIPISRSSCSFFRCGSNSKANNYFWIPVYCWIFLEKLVFPLMRALFEVDGGNSSRLSERLPLPRLTYCHGVQTIGDPLSDVLIFNDESWEAWLRRDGCVADFRLAEPWRRPVTCQNLNELMVSDV